MSKVLNITLYGVNFLINEILYCNNQSTKQASGMGIFHSIILHIIIDTFSMSRSVLFVCLFVCSIVSLFVCLFVSFFLFPFLNVNSMTHVRKLMSLWNTNTDCKRFFRKGETKISYHFKAYLPATLTD